MTDALTHSLEHEIPVLDAENPWPGLAPFDETQAGYFYGRQREVEDLFRLVRLNLLTVLYGQSGLGKTSLVRAALFPRLRGAGLLPVPIRLDYSDGAPPARTQIWQALAGALRQAGTPAAALAEDQTLWEYFHHRSLGRKLIPVLVFDQFEELFTLGPERAGGAGFVRDCLMELAALIENRPPDRVEARFNREPKLVAQFDFDRQDYRVLLSLREDYLAHLHDLTGKIPSITLNNMRLTPLDGVRALEAVEKPGRRLVAPGAAEAIVRVVAGARDERPEGGPGLLDQSAEHRAASSLAPLESLVVDPSLLSLLCRELNQKRQEERLAAITPELVEANRQNILNNFYARCLAGLTEGVQVFVEEDLLTDSGFRETLSVDNAQAKLRRRGADSRALAVLVNRRLLHYEQRGASTRVELTHDVLAPVVRQSRNLRREREAVQEAEARKRRELEENERVAQQARAEAEAKLQRSRQQRRAFMVFGIAMAAVALLAGIQTFRASRATDRALASQHAAEKSARDALEQRRLAEERLQQSNQAELRATAAAKSESLEVINEKKATAIALEQQRRADVSAAAALARVQDMCTYSNEIARQLGDSALQGNVAENIYAAAMEISNQFADSMLAKTPNALCALQLKARARTSSAQALRNQARKASGMRSDSLAALAGRRAREGLSAVRLLSQHDDSLSKTISASVYFDLAYNLFFLGSYHRGFYDSAIQAGIEGAPIADAVDPTYDREARNRLARILFYQGRSLYYLSSYDSAHTVFTGAMDVVSKARGRWDQNLAQLYYTEIQLQWALADVDSIEGHRSEVLSHDRRAVEAARQYARLNPTSSAVEYLAFAWELFGRQAWVNQQRDSARAAFETSDLLRSQLAGERPGQIRAADIQDARSTLQTLRRSIAELELAAPDTGRAIGWLKRRVEVAESLFNGDRPTEASLTGLANSYGRLGRILRFHGDLDEAVNPLVRQVAMDSLLVQATRRSSTALAVYASALQDAAFLAQAKGLYPGAVRGTRRAAEVQREAIDSLRRRQENPSAVRSATQTLAGYLGNLAWYHLFTREPALAVERGREGIRADSTQTFIYTNIAAGLLLSGQVDSAQALYRRMRNVQYGQPSVRFGDQAVQDILDLQKAGVATDADVARVREWSRP